MTLSIGELLQNRYRIVSLLGQGGMGAVYRAWDTRLDIPLAVKEMTSQPGLDANTLAQLRQQFQQEAKVLARLDHSHLVGVIDSFEERNNAYLVMHLVKGESLADRIEREGALPEDQVLTWADQLLDALAYCHSQGVIHRDIKPQNVIIRPDGRAVLVDFGLVKLCDPRDPRTRTVMRGMGTPEYAPPEQYGTHPGHTDPRSDLYSLGATLYHALTGQAPLTVVSRTAAPDQFVPVRGLSRQVSGRTEAMVVRAMELPPVNRFRSAVEMRTALGGGAPALAPPRRQPTKVMPRARPVALPWPRRVPVWTWRGVLLAVAAVCIVGLLVLALTRSLSEPSIPLPSDQPARHLPPGTSAGLPSLVPGHYTVGRWFAYTLNDLCGGQPFGNLMFTVESVDVLSTGELRFNVSWMWRVTDVERSNCPSGSPVIYSDEGNANMYITDEMEHRYDHVAVGDGTGEDKVMQPNVAQYGWFLFPPPAEGAGVFAFHDDDAGFMISGIDLQP